MSAAAKTVAEFEGMFGKLSATERDWLTRRIATDAKAWADVILSEENDRLIAALKEYLVALRTAAGHIEHMAAWIGKQNAGYSFESLGEDMPDIRAAIAKAEGGAP